MEETRKKRRMIGGVLTGSKAAGQLSVQVLQKVAASVPSSPTKRKRCEVDEDTFPHGKSRKKTVFENGARHVWDASAPSEYLESEYVGWLFASTLIVFGCLAALLSPIGVCIVAFGFLAPTSAIIAYLFFCIAASCWCGPHLASLLELESFWVSVSQ